MSFRSPLLVSVATILLLPSVATYAHHSEAAFDMEAVIAFQGTVTEYAWRNPHVYFKVATVDAAGREIEWEVETGATPILARSGWSRESLRIGEQITVRGHPARDRDRHYTILVSLDKTDGTTLQQSVTNSAATASATSLAGIWKGNLANLEDVAQRFRSIPLTAEGAAAREAFDVNVENPAAACIPYPTPATIVVSGFFLTQIEVGDDAIMLRNEWFDTERTIYMDGRRHPGPSQRTLLGHSIGRWEGGTLVVDTRNFADHRSPYQTGVPSGPRKHVVERYTLSEDRRSIAVDFVLEDPDYLAQPLAGSIEWIYRPDLELFEFDCDPAVSSQYTPQ